MLKFVCFKYRTAPSQVVVGPYGEIISPGNMTELLNAWSSGELNPVDATGLEVERLEILSACPNQRLLRLQFFPKDWGARIF